MHPDRVELMVLQMKFSHTVLYKYIEQAEHESTGDLPRNAVFYLCVSNLKSVSRPQECLVHKAGDGAYRSS